MCLRFGWSVKVFWLIKRVQVIKNEDQCKSFEHRSREVKFIYVGYSWCGEWLKVMLWLMKMYDDWWRSLGINDELSVGSWRTWTSEKLPRVLIKIQSTSLRPELQKSLFPRASSVVVTEIGHSSKEEENAQPSWDKHIIWTNRSVDRIYLLMAYLYKERGGWGD